MRFCIHAFSIVKKKGKKRDRETVIVICKSIIINEQNSVRRYTLKMCRLWSVKKKLDVVACFLIQNP